MQQRPPILAWGSPVLMTMVQRRWTHAVLMVASHMRNTQSDSLPAASKVRILPLRCQILGPDLITPACKLTHHQQMACPHRSICAMVRWAHNRRLGRRHWACRLTKVWDKGLVSFSCLHTTNPGAYGNYRTRIYVSRLYWFDDRDAAGERA